LKNISIMITLPLVFVLSFSIMATSASGTGNLWVGSDQYRSDVYIDNVYRGYTPWQVNALPAAQYTVKVSKPGFHDNITTITVNEGDWANFYANLLLINPQGTPDLVVSEIKPSSTLPAFGYVNVNVTVSNIGNQTTSGLGVFSTKMEAPGSATGFQRLFYYGLIAPGGSQTVSGPLLYESLGGRTLTATADMDNQINESNEMNNVLTYGSAPPGNQTSRGEDLTVSKVYFTQTGTGASTVRLNVEVSNIGSASSESSILRFMSRTGRTGEITVPGLAAGQSREFQFDPLPISFGNDVYTAVADYYSGIPEMDETNNVKSARLSVSSLDDNTAGLYIETNPTGARTYFDLYNFGEETGKSTPITIIGLKPGMMNLTITNAGYQFIDTPVTVNPGAITSYAFTMSQLQTGPDSKPDLIVRGIRRSPPNAYGFSSGAYLLTYIQNIGDVTTGGPNTFGVGDIVNGDNGYHYDYREHLNSFCCTGVSYLGPGEIWPINSGYLTPGTYSVRVETDVFSEVAEKNETNNIAEATLVILDSSSPSPAQCGNGICESGESVSNCFIDCRTSSNGSSCSGIAPLPEAGQAPVQTAQNDTVPGNDGMVLDVYYSPDADSNSTPGINVSSKQAFDGYIVQFDEEPIAAVDSRIDADIATEEAQADGLKREINSVNTDGVSIVPGTIKKFMLNRQLSGRERTINSARANRASIVAQHKTRINNSHKDFRQNIGSKLANGERKIKEEYDTAFNGMLLDVSDEEVESIASIPGVKRISPNNIISIDLSTSVGYVKADSAWNLNDTNGNKITGQGRTIAIIDTGVDYTHPDLGGCFGAGNTTTAGTTVSNQSLQGTGPDLTVTGITFSNPTPSSPQTETITVTVKNVGSASPPGDSFVDIDIDNQGTRLGLSGPLAPNQSANVSMQRWYNRGGYYISAKVGSFYYNETNTANDVMISRITVGDGTNTGSIAISSNVQGEAYFDDAYVGLTPVTLQQVTEGAHMLKLRRAGYIDSYTFEQVTRGTTVSVMKNLALVSTNPLPDLVVTDAAEIPRADVPLNLPCSAEYCATPIVYYLVKNIGGAKAVNPIFGVSGGEISTREGIGIIEPYHERDTLFPGESSRLILGPATYGNLLFSAIADVDGVIPEVSETNNNYSETINYQFGSTNMGTYTPTSNNSVPGQTASIYADSTPGGATVSVDEVVKGISPLTVTGLTAGNHSVYYALDGYYSSSITALTVEGVTTTISPKLIVQSGNFPDLTVTNITFSSPNLTTGYTEIINVTIKNVGNAATPPGGVSVDLRWNNQWTRLGGLNLPAGASRTVTFGDWFNIGGYYITARIVSTYYNETNTANDALTTRLYVGDLSNTGNLAVTSNVPADLYLGEGLLGQTPMTLETITEGVHILKLKKSGYQDSLTFVTVTRGTTTSSSRTLLPVSTTPLPDLVALDAASIPEAAPPMSFAPGYSASTRIHYLFQNIGGKKADYPITAAVKRGSQEIFKTGVGGLFYQGLSPGEATVVTIGLGSELSGTSDAIAQADPDNRITEISELNNNYTEILDYSDLFSSQGSKIAQNNVDNNSAQSPGNNASCKVVGGWDFQNNDTDPMDDHGHGTHVAATAAGNGVLKGVAPDAKIYAYKVCSSAGSCSYSNIIAAINKALDPNGDGDLSDHVDVISISLGGSGTPDDPASQAVDNAFNKGVFLSIAAGNSGPNSQTINCPGCARKATTVAAWCKPENMGNGYCSSGPIASFSSVGPVKWSGGVIDKPDIAAPGVSICAAEWDSAWSASRCIDNSHVAISGTSMATPHVAGAAALIKQAHPTWNPQQIKDALLKTAVDQGMDKYKQGAGLVNVLAAITQSDTFPTANLDISGKVTGTVDVNGTAFSANFTSYTLEYGTGNSPSSWTLITESSTPVINSKLGSLDTLSLTEGSTYTLRLTVRNSLGEASNKTRTVEANNVFITSPSATQDVVSGQDTLMISGTAIGSSFASYKVEYGTGYIPSSWSTNGITLAANGLAQRNNELLATWDTSVAQLGVYTLKLTVLYSGGQTASEAVTVYVDPSLHKGWPKQLEPCAPGWCPTVVLNPAVADIDNDGAMEILTSVAKYDEAGNTVSYRHVFRADGTIAKGWPMVSIDHLNNGFVVSDINNDGTNELIINDGSAGKIYSPDGRTLGTFYTPYNQCIVTADIDRAFPGKEILFNYGTQLMILHNDGTFYKAPYRSTAGTGCPAVGDVNNDGASEVATAGYSKIYLFDENGNTVTGWPKDTGEMLDNGPVFGDLDGDSKLEILTGGNNGTLSVYRNDGSAFSGFPLRLDVGYGQSDPVISDVDGDGVKDIIIRSGRKVYVIKNNGIIAAGWPQTMADYGSLVNPVIGDLDGDSDKEIVVGRYAWHHDGTSVTGFPKKIKDIFLGYRSSSALADVDGDGKIELVIGPTQFEHFIYVYDLLGTPASVDGSMVQHDPMHTGNYNLATWQTPSQFARYYYYNLTDSECTVNLTLSSISGNQTLNAQYAANACNDSWDGSVAAVKGQSASLIKGGLNKGSYAVYVSGIGSYTLGKSGTCLTDATKPLITVSNVPSQTKGDLQLTAAVSDTNGLKGCEGCISTDGICDTEWQAAVKNFIYGDKQGLCSFTFPGSGLSDNLYTLNIRVEDIAANKAEGVPQSAILDRTGPMISLKVISASIETSSLITVSSGITDLSAIANVTATLAASSASLKKSNASGLYEGALATPAAAGSYNLSVTALDAAGNAATNSTTIFVSQPVIWSAPVKIVSAERKAASPEIAQAKGNFADFAVVWEDSSDGSPDIYYSRISPSAQLLTFAKKLTNTVYNSREPHVFAEMDKTHIVWQDDRDGNNEIYYSQLMNGEETVSNKRFTFNLFESTTPKVASDGTMVHVFWIDNRDSTNSLYHAQLDYSGNKLAGDTKLAGNVSNYAVAASESAVMAAWVSDGKAYYGIVSADAIQNAVLVGDAAEVALGAAAESYLVTASGTGIKLSIIGLSNASGFSNSSGLKKSVALASAGAAPSVSVGQGRVNMLWNSPDAKHAVLDLSGNLLMAEKPLIPAAKGKIAGDNATMAILVQQTGELSIVSTSVLEKTAPVIQLARTEEVQRQTALVTIKTDEPSYATAASGSSFNQSSPELNYSHLLLIENLQPSTAYSIQITASDAAGNTRTALTNLTTKAQVSKPALPTTFYGTVMGTGGELLGGINVTAYWTDVDNINRTTPARTIGSGSLLGYYIFNTTNVNARDGSVIIVSAADAVQEATLPAQPGSLPVNVSQPVIVDKTPPAVAIISPGNGATYTSIFMFLNFTASEPLSSASFALNGNAPVTVTGKEGLDVNITARIGQNNLTLTAKDKLGLAGQATSVFTVEDKVPPVVRINAIAYARNITVITANVTDSTNSLSYCEVCAGLGCNWQTAQNNFGAGSMQGKCIYSWNTAGIADGSHPITFRATDESGNTGVSETATAKVDNTKPQQQPLTAQPVSGQNKVVLKWQQSSDSDFKQYAVYRASSPAQLIATITNISQTEFTDSTVSSGQNYSYAVVVIDQAGNSADPLFQKITAPDTIAPIVSILQPQSGKTYNTSSVLLGYSVSEAASWCGYSINGIQKITVSGATPINAAEGNNVLVLYCNDTGQNQGNSSVSFIVDTKPPLPVNFTASAVPKKTQLQISWTRSPASDFARYNIYRSSSSFQSATIATRIATVPDQNTIQYTDFSVASQQSYFYAVTATDINGNENTSIASKQAIASDTVSPSITLLSPQQQIYKNASVKLQYTANENLAWCGYRLNSNSTVQITGNATIKGLEGANTVTLYCNDTSQNQGIASSNFDADAEIPTNKISSVSSIKGRNSLLLNWSPSGSRDFSMFNVYRNQGPFSSLANAAKITTTGATNYEDTGLLSETTYYYTVTSTDIYGNENTTVLLTSGKVADLTPPPSLLTTATAANRALSIKVSWEKSKASDFSNYSIYRSTSPYALSTQASKIATISGINVLDFTDTNVMSDTAYYYSVAAQDISGNENKSILAAMAKTYDSKAPTITIVQPQNKTYATRLLNLSIGADEQANCTYTLNNGQKQSIASASFLSNEQPMILLTSVFGNEKIGVSLGASSSNQLGLRTYMPASGYITSVTAYLQWNGTGSNNGRALIYRDGKSLDASSATVPVIVLKYFPTKADGSLDLSQTGDWQNPSLDALRQQVNYLTQSTVAALQNGSKSKGFRDSSSNPHLTYDIVMEKEYLRQISKSQAFSPFADHIMELNGINICDWVDNKGIKEVWIWMTHNSNIVPIESNMAGPYGDISNSYRQDDLPVCQHTYTVYDYNYGRGTSEAIEDHGHQLEALFRYADSDVWNKYVYPINVPAPTINHCGWTHYPPNGRSDYDWYNTIEVLSDCEDWNPDSNPQPKMISCREWSETGNCYSQNITRDGNLGFKIWWMQNMPGPNNAISYNGAMMRNWWEFVSDFDSAMAKGRSLRKPAAPSERITASEIKPFSSAPGWVTFNFLSPVPVEQGYYWLSILGQEPGAYTYCDAISAPNFEKRNAPWPDSESPLVPTSYSNCNMSVYATYTNELQNINLTTMQITAAEGGNKVIVSCSDANLNNGSAEATFSTDTTSPPQVQLTSVSPARGIIMLTWQPGTDANSYSIYRSASEFSSTAQASKIGVAASPVSSYNDTTVQSETTYYYAVAAADNLGNENTTTNSKPATAADTTPPSKVSGLSVSPVPGKAELSLAWQLNSEKDVKYYAIYRGNASFTTAQQGLLVANATTNYYYDTGLRSEATYYYAVTAVDNLTNENTTVTSIGGTTADITPPSVSITSPAPKTYNTSMIPLKYSVSEPVACTYSLNGALPKAAEPYINAAEGNNMLVLACVDGAGNTGNASLAFSVDTTPPEPVVLTASRTPKKESVTLNWTRSLASDFEEYILYKSQQNFTNYPGPAIAIIKDKMATSYADSLVKSEQTYYYALAVRDIAGNANATLKPVQVTIEDLSPPNITIISPENRALYSTASIPLLYSTSESVSNCSYSLNGNNYPVTENITAMEGPNTLILTCEDINSNKGNAIVQFYSDSQSPAPIQGLIAAWNPNLETIELSWEPSTATDLKNYNIYRSIKYFQDSGESQQIKNTSETRFSDYAVDSEKTYYYAVAAVDLYNNENKNVIAVEQTVPDIIPPAAIQNLKVSPVPKQTSLEIAWEPSLEDDFGHYTIYRGNSAFSSAATNIIAAIIADRNTSNYTDTNLGNGKTYYYAVTASDKTGNEIKIVTPAAATVSDLTKPIVIVQQVPSPAYGLLILRATLTDNSLKQSCEACITQNASICSWVSATNGFPEGSQNGTCTFAWQSPSNGESYYYAFRVNDTSDNQAEGEPKQFITVNLNEEISYDLELYRGWNMISFPITPNDNGIKSVMQPINGKYTRMFNYDSLAKSWRSHFAEDTIFNPEETIKTIEAGKGYWIEMLENTPLTVTGTRVVTYSGELHEGWNMIGYPYEVSASPQAALDSGSYYTVFHYNTTDAKWERYSPYPTFSQPNTITTLQPGRGYMIDMKQEATWIPQRPQ